MASFRFSADFAAIVSFLISPYAYMAGKPTENDVIGRRKVVVFKKKLLNERVRHISVV